ncbi:chromosome segregation protein SMC [Pseudomonas sp. 10B238]|jgi:predicted ATPase|uniref:AAA family ATPase n=1 Tax=Pseudomonas sp. 10B238 TaxID=1586417 RepID=UPI0006181FE2|nr:AAA family ATPase [Pseudomonas sp. 10B238]KJJ61604.1 chromosome segregation protein SMC [Pseudomonas sp. 10B238]MAL37554.1 chromosome segregation protein SMC [Pseudomonas sp.]HBM09586.1 chromosome segregation protein SMC [Pseudomonas sp.]|tara:strand:- start:3948 stop:5678 length:1731 start_codon:yes stop_codon:yes gene_type:complete
MRLDKLTIGSAKDSQTHQFKNLKNVTIDFDQDHWVTVVIGWNGTGKSNVLEALAIIFRDLIGKERKPAFAFKLAYRMGTGEGVRHIHVDADPDRESEPFIIHVATDSEARGEGTLIPFIEVDEAVSALRGKAIKLTAFLNADAEYLPRYVFSYYSGESTRMYEVFSPYLESYDSKLRNGVDPGLKRLFYAMPVHSHFVLLAFMIQQSDVVRAFLDDHLGIDPDDGIESVLFVLRQPPWKSKAPDGDPRFWNARGVVRDFLSRLHDIALAPIEISRQVSTSIWNKKKLEFKYLFVKDIAALRRFVGNQAPAQFFRDLESTYVSELIEEVRIRVRLKKNDGSVIFRELSEGEQQLLTVLGLLRFTAEDESLFLLDEPDTHLNPRWSVDYIAYLKQFIASGTRQEETSHILLTTHNPLAIAELDREQVQILRMAKQDGQWQIVACYPEMAPRGMGYAAIVTSDMFGIASSLDQPTQELLEAQRAFAAKERLTPDEQRELDGINSQLDRLGFRFFHPDDEYSRYLRLRYELLAAHFETGLPRELALKVVQMSRNDREALARRLIQELVKQRDLPDPAGQS